MSRLRGKLYPTPTPLVWADAANDMEIATEGPVKNGCGGAAFFIHSRSTPGTLQSVIPIAGDPRSTTSYQTELFGILGTIIFTHQLLTASGTTWMNLTSTLWCNNVTAVNNYNELKGQLLFYLKEANKTVTDVLQEL